ncbi:SIS domain-containing protein [Paenibacillus qinlingensis]|uniref:D-sedoheptulose 7-phosphate isomerase n=1 Tax=Paenibacillus qinlingensis TaxID=1837343 RepID=A0ABU1NYT5_9BACL|nr:SIS domain-containing protein [Paenibacillus qinlingensis]MDR6552231.1 D-sedoheptulose 7-phosphate isomerase [Paenibacillus qinlingensis]
MSQILDQLIVKYPELETCLLDIQRAVELISDCYRGGGKVLVCGNGGSASDSEHIVGELMKGFMSKRPISSQIREQLEKCYPGEGHFLADHLQGALPAISLVSHTALATAFSNDVSAETVFAQQVYGYGVKGDVLLGLSTSGNSANVVRAIQVAKVQGLTAIGLTGQSGGRMNELCDVTIRVPSDRTPDIQERHLPIYHAICMLLEEEFFQ